MRERPLCLLTLIWIAVILIIEVPQTARGGGTSAERQVRSILSEAAQVSVRGTVERTSVQDTSAVCTLSHSYLYCGDARIPIQKVKLYLEEDEYYPSGYILEAKGMLQTPRAAENPGNYDAEAAARINRTYYEMRSPDITVLSAKISRIREWMNQLRARAADRLRERYPETAASVYGAILIGDKDDLTEETRLLWRHAGLMHMLAISGLHLTLLGMGAFAVLKRICFSAVCFRAGRRLVRWYRKCSRRRRRRILHVYATDSAGDVRSGARNGPEEGDYAGKERAEMPASSLIATGRIALYTAGILSAVLMFQYTWFTGMSVSSVRACVMFFLAVSASMAGRTYDPPTALSLAALLILIENPLYLFHSGFQMSFAAAFSCIVFRKRGSVMLLVLLNLWILPIQLYTYYEIALCTVPVNLLAVSLLPALMFSGLIGMLGPAGSVFAMPGIFMADAVMKVLRILSQLPGTVKIMGRPYWYQIVFYYILLALWTYIGARWRRYKRRYVLYVAVPFLILLLWRGLPGKIRWHLLHDGDMRLTFLSVGQGDSAYVKMPDGAVMLVDAGSVSLKEVGRYRVLPYLSYEGAGWVDYAVVTHMDADHVNGIEEILGMMERHETPLEIGTLLMPYLKNPEEPYRELAARAEALGIRVRTVRKGDELRFDNVQIEVMNPDPECEEAGMDGDGRIDANAQCIVLGIHMGDFDALLTGDVSGAGEEQLTSQLKEAAEALKGDKEPDEDADADRAEMDWSGSSETGASEETAHLYEVLKVAHHGSRFSTPSDFLQDAGPALCVISCGRNNIYGHPHEELLARLSDTEAEICRTDEDGAVIVRTDGRTYRFERYRCLRFSNARQSHPETASDA